MIKATIYLKTLFIVICFCMGKSFSASGQTSEKFKYKVAIIGNPSVPEINYTQENFNKLKRLGFNTIQLNIAWGARPADEPLNLEDILSVEGEYHDKRVPERFEEIRARAQKAKEAGFRTIFHFGAPHIHNLYQVLSPSKMDSATCANSIEDPEIVNKYTQLVTKLATKIPEIDDILIYTFDQDAWIGSQFGYCEKHAGNPLHERVPVFINALRDAWAAQNPDGILWWEPWEMSGGQTYKVVDQLPSENFGFMLHSNVAEVQASRPVDPWFRNMARLAGSRGIPVVGELFLSSANEEVAPLVNVVTPRLVHHALSEMERVPAIVGIKEYYGLLLDKNDPNLEMAGYYFNSGSEPELESALKHLAKEYGTGQQEIINGWNVASSAYNLMPWDVSWRFRDQADSRKLHFHNWEAFWIPGVVAPSPSWKSTRKSVFMLTSNKETLHPWMIEDLGLRCEMAADSFAVAIDYYTQALEKTPVKFISDIEAWIKNIEILKLRMRDYALHAKETLAAYNIRRFLEKEKQVPQHMYDRLRSLLVKDIENQQSDRLRQDFATPQAKLQSFDKNPDRWVMNNLLYDPGWY